MIRSASTAAAAERGPQSCYEVIDPRFKALIDPVAFLESIHTGNRWSEGPVYFADLCCLLWSDIPNQRMLCWDEESGAVSLFRKPTLHANGNTRDREGRLIACEQGGRRVTRTEWDGTQGWAGFRQPVLARPMRLPSRSRPTQRP